MGFLFRLLWGGRGLMHALVLFLLMRIWKYRKGVIVRHYALYKQYLKKHSKDAPPLNAFMRAAYTNLASLLTEALALPFAHRPFLRKRYRFVNPGLVHDLLHQDIPVLLTVSHTGNWEWGALALPLEFHYPVYSAYKPIRNSFWNRTLLRLRQRNGTRCLDRTQAPSFFKNQGGPWIFVLIMDQYPHASERRQLLPFLGVETAVYSGLETLARMSKARIIHARCTRTRNFAYQIEFIDLQKEYPQTKGATEAYFLELERFLIRHPEQWLWSHKRWKNIPHFYE